MHSHELSNLSAIGLTFVILSILFADTRRDIRRLILGRNVVLMSIIAWFLVEAIQLPFELRRYSQSSYDFGVICVALGLLAFLFGYHSLGRGCVWFDSPALRIRFMENRDLLWRVVLIGAVLGFAPIAYYSGLRIVQLLHDILGMRKTWGGVIARGQYGDSRAAILMLEMFIRGVCPFAILLLLDRQVPSQRRIVCLFIALWPIMRAFGSGTRSSMITSTLPVLAVFFWSAKPATQKKMIWGGLACTPIIYLFMIAMVTSRTSGTFSWAEIDRTNYIGHEMFRELLFITEKVPDEVSYQWGQFYYVQIINPIPRFLWEGKPKTSSPVFLSRLYGRVFPGTDQVYVTTHPGLIGEMYLHFGIPAIVILSAFGGWLVRGWDRIVQSHHKSTVTMIFYSAGLAVLIVMGRSFSVNYLYKLIALGVLAYIVPYLGSRIQAVSEAERRRQNVNSDAAVFRSSVKSVNF